MTADKISFRNVLLAAKPDLKKNDLPSSYDVTVYLKKKFTEHIADLKNEVEVSPFSNCTNYC